MAGGWCPPFTPLLATTQGGWGSTQSIHWKTGQTHKTGPYTSGEAGELGQTATFSSVSSASCCPRPSSSAWECFSSALSGKAGGLRTRSLASNKEATVLELVGREGLNLRAYWGQRAVRETRRATPGNSPASLPHSLPSRPPLKSSEEKIRHSHPHGKKDGPITLETLRTAGAQWILLIGHCYSSASPGAHSNSMNLKTKLFLLPGEQRHWQIHSGLWTSLRQKGSSVWLLQVQGPCIAL